MSELDIWGDHNVELVVLVGRGGRRWPTIVVVAEVSRRWQWSSEFMLLQWSSVVARVDWRRWWSKLVVGGTSNEVERRQMGRLE